MSKFLIEKLQGLAAYVPGEQPKDKKYIKLNTNESPFPPSINVLKAIDTSLIGDLKLYCNPECTSLVDAFCSVYDVNKENIIFGNGSDEILNYCFTAFFSEKNPVVFPDITYGFYKVFGDLYNIDYTEILLKNDFSIDINDYIGINKNIVIANPNAPTGICLSVEDIEKIVKSNPDNIVVVDEAYIDFGGESCYKLTNKYDNLLVTGTFSKSRSLAGARLGFAIGNKELIADLNKIKYSTNPYNINSLTQAVGTATLLDNDYYLNNCKTIIKNREFTVQNLKELGFEVLDSKANFVFAKHPDFEGEFLYKELYNKGILVRHFKNERIKDYLRITIGTSVEMTALIFAITKIIERG
ncbi:MAG: histidinol-phosphate transaminase [Clostridia bacterium]|nr:histidinol-phosphate transaminase [Clostridia bacterium]